MSSIESAAAPAADGGSISWHLTRTASLAWPIILSRAGLIILFTADTIVTGRAGGLELAGLALGVAPLLTIMLVTLGTMQSTVVLAAQAIGQGRPADIGGIFRAGCVNALALGLASALLAIWAEPFFLVTGQAPDVSRVAAGVAQQFAWGMPGQLLLITANLILEATDRPRAGMLIILAANLLNILLDGVLVLGWFGYPATGGAATAMATSSVARWAAFGAAFAVLIAGEVRNGDRYGIRARLSAWTRSAVSLGGETGRTIRRMGLPMGLGQGVESAAFATLVFMAGLIGTAALAAHQTTMTVMSLVYMNAVGIGGAASIRVGNAVGRRSPVDLKRAGWSAIALGGLFSGVCGIVMVLMPESIARAVVDDPSAVAIATTTLHLAGYFVAFDAMMGVSMGALRGLGDVWAPLYLQSAAFWFVAVPVAWGFGFHLEMGAVGLFFGMGAGIAASNVLLLPRFAAASQRLTQRWSTASHAGQDGAAPYFALNSQRKG